VIDQAAIDLLREVQIGSGLEREGQDVRILVTGCAYSCCGKGWRRRDGYRQKYIGYIDNLTFPEYEGQRGTFMLYAKRLQAVVAVGFDEVEEVVVAGASWPAHW
jgi:hypothetical protein